MARDSGKRRPLEQQVGKQLEALPALDLEDDAKVRAPELPQQRLELDILAFLSAIVE